MASEDLKQCINHMYYIYSVFFGALANIHFIFAFNNKGHLNGLDPRLQIQWCRMLE